MDLARLASRLRAPAATAVNASTALVPLVTRLTLGIAFAQAGLGKWTHFDNTVLFFTNLGIPAPATNAAFVATLELVGGAALVLGFGTRVFAALLSSTMVVAILTADRADFVLALSFGGDKGLLDVVPFAYLLWLAWLIGRGAGPVSLDRALFRRLSFEPASAVSEARA